MITEPIQPGFYRVRWYTPFNWTVAEWRIGQKVPWSSRLCGAWFVIGHRGPIPLVTFSEIGEKVEC